MVAAVTLAAPLTGRTANVLRACERIQTTNGWNSARVCATSVCFVPDCEAQTSMRSMMRVDDARTEFAQWHPSLGLDVRCLDHRRPLLRFSVQEFREALR